MAKKVKDLIPSERNPRKISQAQLDRLTKSMDEYGDLSGLVFNCRTDRIVGGHQRRKLFNDAWPIIVEQRAKKGQALDTHGTVALGYVENPETKARWTYREVDWDEKREMAASIAANVQGGEFDELLKRDAIEFIDDGTLDLDLIGGKDFVEEAMTWTPDGSKKRVEFVASEDGEICTKCNGSGRIKKGP